MKKTLSRLGRLSVARAIRDDDLIDQLHHFVTVTAFLGLSTFFTLGKTMTMPPVRCWVPAQYTEKLYRHYINHYCWVNGLYNIPFDEEIPTTTEDRYTEDRSVLYYRWIAVTFFLQAIMFKIPNLIWKLLKSSSGINMEKVLEITLQAQIVPDHKRREELTAICDHFTRWRKVNRKYEVNTRLSFIMAKGRGCYITRLYLFIKMLFLINVIVQFKILSSILDFNYWMYGADVIRMLYHQVEDISHFPRTALCDFEIRQMQNVHRYTVQCSLPFNMFVEKVFAAEWFVLVFLCVLTVFSLVRSTTEHLCKRQDRFVKKYIRMMKLQKGSKDVKLFRKFVQNCLMDDGMYVLRMISNNSSEVLAFELLEIMWLKFCKERRSYHDERMM